MENCVSSAALDAARTRLDAAEAARETILLQHIANGVIIDSRTVPVSSIPGFRSFSSMMSPLRSSGGGSSACSGGGGSGRSGSF